jgi:hypothetical protein
MLIAFAALSRDYAIVAGGLYRHGLQSDELEAVLAVHAATDRTWLKEALVRYLPKSAETR